MTGTEPALRRCNPAIPAELMPAMRRVSIPSLAEGRVGMIGETKGPIPTEINLHRKSRLLGISFSDGRSFSLPCEYLRVNSHAAEVTTRGTPETGKENVNIDRIEPQGSYAIRIAFDDGHDTGIYSWETLYDLGVNQEKYWQECLDRLAGEQRQAQEDYCYGLGVVHVCGGALVGRYRQSGTTRQFTPCRGKNVTRNNSLQ